MSEVAYICTMMYYFFLSACLLVWSCETAPQDKPTEIPLPPKMPPKVTATLPKPAMDTIKPAFKTLPLQPLKTGIADLQASLQAGKPMKIVCYGNSITHGFRTGRAGKVANPYPESLAKQLRTRYPNAQLTIKNEGHNGWRADQALAAVTQLVLPEKPDWVILELGINDAYSSFSPATYTQYMKQIVQILQKNGAKVLLMSATPIATPYHEKVLAYHAPLRALAESEGCAFFDLATAIADRAEQEKVLPADLLPDDVHFADDKYSWISEAIVAFIK